MAAGLFFLTILAFLCGGPLLVFLVAALGIVALGVGSARRKSQLPFGILAGSAVTGVTSAVYVWWVLGVQIDAADSSSPVPAAARHGGIGLIVLALSIAVFSVSAIVGIARHPH
jgi:hypothetical protein